MKKRFENILGAAAVASGLAGCISSPAELQTSMLSPTTLALMNKVDSTKDHTTRTPNPADCWQNLHGQRCQEATTQILMGKGVDLALGASGVSVALLSAANTPEMHRQQNTLRQAIELGEKMGIDGYEIAGFVSEGGYTCTAYLAPEYTDYSCPTRPPMADRHQATRQADQDFKTAQAVRNR